MSLLKSQTCDPNLYQHRLALGSHMCPSHMTHNWTAGPNTSNKDDNRAKRQKHHAFKRKNLRKRLSLGPHGCKITPSAKLWQTEDMSCTMQPRACEGGKGV